MSKNYQINTVNPNIIPTKLSMFLMSLLVFSMTGCQSLTANEDYSVMQRSNQVYETTGYGESKAKARHNAIKNATKNCYNLSPVVITDTMTYNGLVNEKLVRMADQAGSIVGSVIGATTPNLFRDDDYEFTIVFKCQ